MSGRRPPVAPPLGGAVVGRIVSLAVDGAPRPVTLAFLAVEAAGAEWNGAIR